MDELRFITIFEKYSVEILVFGIVVCLLYHFLKKVVPEKINDYVCLIPFVLGILLYTAYGLIFSLGGFDVFFTKGIQVGAVATIYYAIFSRTKSKDDSQKVIKDILMGIVKKGSLDKVTERISQLLGEDFTKEEVVDTIAIVIAEFSSIDDGECRSISNIIIKALGLDQENQN